jgi:hypothetical protein
MNDNLVIFHFILICLSLFSIIYTFGVVWRVEKKLDIAFKLFLTAIIFFTGSEIILFLPLQSTQFFSLIAQIIFAIFFLAGTLEMRSMLRRMDGEIKK